MELTQNGRSAHGARKSAVFGNSVRSLMLVLLTTSHPAWLPVALAQPVPGGLFPEGVEIIVRPKLKPDSGAAGAWTAA